MRTFAIGDIHGGLKALLQVLNKIEITEKDSLIFMGDYVDGWSESAQVVQFLMELSKKFNCVFIKGNHDVWCEDWLKNGNVNASWYLHGGKETMDSYEGFCKEDKKKHLQFFENLPLFHIDAKNRLFLHAGFTSLYGVEREIDVSYFYTDRSFWEMVLALDKNIPKTSLFYPKRLQLYDEIYIGHTPTTNYNEPLPMNIANVWNIDTGAAFKGKITAINIDSKTIFQSENLPFLYPNEKGRNKS
ncbi:MAG: serine/threonine protein phosphatase [Flavobacteriia bacterium]|nr:serine/threonine protein phosphatase [Flavobacteriia bacterium]OIP47070.1 MAG: serine/threonine protein phosphatase [Flavobacteriaceae bacterium CG2_30_31_66]PIV97801.1 MAG: serine/threonine protein phosphatase [Flavobacteriaceae bacterium CG17_big_fil_post_rev_8_21_14_2_50_31_13]PIX12893.1 MAG: serine/threonine protein phosphatase [Flavobacteriaceae bacterium CG_4_8_14_3_um_filter_31_8]PIY14538.1 MAG: serine/threonine protein phosphatase [Flavobacteriaceae bacterium CG_4_10_14_3_um_filter_3